MDICSFAYVWALSGPQVGYIIIDDALQYVLFIIRLRLNQHLPIAMGKCRLWVNVSSDP